MQSALNCESGPWNVRLLPETGTDFGNVAVPLLLEHLRTLLPAVGRRLDGEALPRLLFLHSNTS